MGRAGIAVGVALALAFACVVVATLHLHGSSRAIAGAADEIARHASPEIHRLMTARGELRRLEAELRRAAAGVDGAQRDSQAALKHAIAAVETSRSSKADEAPDGRADDSLLARQLGDVEKHTAQVLERLAAKQGVDAELLIDGALHESIDAATLTLQRIAEREADRAATLAHQIDRTRRRADDISIVLVTLAAAFALVLGMLAIASQRSAARALEERNRLEASRAAELEEFACRVAHDIGGALASTTLALSLATEQAPDARRVLERGARGVHRAQSIVHALLRFARAGAQRDPTAHTEVARLLSDLKEALSSDAEEAHVTLTVAPVDPGVEVPCEPGLLATALDNLVRNAVKYMGSASERRVDVRALPNGGRLRFEVQDTGPGVPAELQRRIFQPYVRGTNTGEPGIGLGLATVRRIVEAYGGSVGVESHGRGSLFWFELPRAQPGAQAAHPA